jgi:hypothetical protein
MESPHSPRPAVPGWVRRAHSGVVRWRFFLGASFLTAALVIPRAGVVPVAVGIVLAGAVQFAYMRLRRALAGSRGADSD